MYTFQDFEKAPDKLDFLSSAIQRHMTGDEYKIAQRADNYDRQLNETIHNYVRLIFSLTGSPIEDFTASNNRIASNFFHRLNTQRCTYSLGNGISFSDHKETVIDPNGLEVIVDVTKEMLGERFDTDLKHLAYKALIHGVSYGFWNVNRLYVFPVTEFVPLLDESTGTLKAGIRFWQLEDNKPMQVVLYEVDGFTKYASDEETSNMHFHEVQEKKPYKITIKRSEVEGEEVVGEDNYDELPIIPLYGSLLKQSTLIGMQSAIDSFDLIRSGFANDLTDCSQVYWILENCGGMTDAELAKFRDRLKINHIAKVDTDNSKATPYTQEIPYQARKEYLDHIRAGIYEDFGALDVHTISAGATNDHIDAGYQPMDEEADDFEFQIIEFMDRLLALMNIEDTPVFKRNRISNQKEQVEMIMMEANYLDDETILQKLPNISVDEIAGIMARRDAMTESRLGVMLEEEDEATNNPLNEEEEQNNG